MKTVLVMELMGYDVNYPIESKTKFTFLRLVKMW